MEIRISMIQYIVFYNSMQLFEKNIILERKLALNRGQFIGFIGSVHRVRSYS